MIKVASERCPQDHTCPMITKCPQKAISQSGYAAPEVNPQLCVECGICTSRCPYGVFQKSK